MTVVAADRRCHGRWMSLFTSTSLFPVRANVESLLQRDSQSAAGERVRHAEAAAVGRDYLLSRAELAHFGIDRWDIRREVSRGRWAVLGRHSVAVHRGPLTKAALPRHALHEVGSHGALDGPAR